MRYTIVRCTCVLSTVRPSARIAHLSSHRACRKENPVKTKRCQYNQHYQILAAHVALLLGTRPVQTFAPPPHPNANVP